MWNAFKTGFDLDIAYGFTARSASHILTTTIAFGRIRCDYQSILMFMVNAVKVSTVKSEDTAVFVWITQLPYTPLHTQGTFSSPRCIPFQHKSFTNIHP